MITNIFTTRIDWNGITVEISYEAAWGPASSADFDIAHLQVRSIAPERAVLPITNTGYRSLFVPSEEIVELGGPVTYVREWLELASRSPDWKAQQDAARQYSLF